VYLKAGIKREIFISVLLVPLVTNTCWASATNWLKASQRQNQQWGL